MDANLATSENYRKVTMAPDDQQRLDYLTAQHATAKADSEAMVADAEEYRRQNMTLPSDRQRRHQNALEAYALTLSAKRAKARWELNACRIIHGLLPVEDK